MPKDMTGHSDIRSFRRFLGDRRQAVQFPETLESLKARGKHALVDASIILDMDRRDMCMLYVKDETGPELKKLASREGRRVGVVIPYDGEFTRAMKAEFDVRYDKVMRHWLIRERDLSMAFSDLLKGRFDAILDVDVSLAFIRSTRTRNQQV